MLSESSCPRSQTSLDARDQLYVTLKGTDSILMKIVQLYSKYETCGAPDLNVCESKCNCFAASICESQGWTYYADDTPVETLPVVTPCCKNDEPPFNCLAGCGFTCEADTQSQSGTTSTNSCKLSTFDCTIMKTNDQLDQLVSKPGACTASVLALCTPKCVCDANAACAA